MMKKIYLGILVVGLLSSCNMGSNFYVNFDDVQSEPGMFRVTRQQNTDMLELVANGGIKGMDGVELGKMTLNDNPSTSAQPEGSMRGPQRASATTLTNVIQNLLDFRNARRVIELSGVYESIDVNGDPIILSGKVLLPANGKIKRCILVSHYTIASNAEAPSNTFPLEGVLVKLGYAMIVPDYIGYGVTADKVHPYLVMNLTARNVLDMYKAVIPFLEHAGCVPEHDDIYLMGYSQGGATTMAVQHLIEHHNEDVKLRRVFAGGGPYDVKATYDRFVETDTASYPCAVPIMMQGMVVGNNLDLDMSELMAPFIYDNLDEWVNSKRYTTKQINNMIGSYVTHELLTEKGMDRTSQEVSELYKAMTNNSILSYSWVPKAPVFIMHSINDETVPYENANRAKNKWKGANIQYSLGYYGGHVITCVRFIYAVQTLLINEEKEEGGHYEF
jgi:pimeloyl-ACP methyl ester carboxylesterase